MDRRARREGMGGEIPVPLFTNFEDAAAVGLNVLACVGLDGC